MQLLDHFGSSLIFLGRNRTELVPEDRFERAQVLQWMFFEQYDHEPAIAVARFLLRYSDRPRGDFEERLDGLWAAGYRALDAMEAHLADRDWLVGDRMTLADIALYAYTHVAEEGEFDLSRYEAIPPWLDRVAAQPGHIPITA